MTEKKIQQVIFDDIDLAVEAIEKLREIGIPDEEMDVISGLPYSHHILGRPYLKNKIPMFAIVGFLVGAVISLVLNFGTPILYPVYVGGMPLLSIPPTIVLTFEISMLGLMIFSFFGVIWECSFPRLKPVEYSTKVSDGNIALLFKCPEDIQKQAEDMLLLLGAESVEPAEVMQ
jgi:hypothetical protein